MKALHMAMPAVLMGIHHIEVFSGQPCGGQGKPQLIDPSGAAQVTLLADPPDKALGRRKGPGILWARHVVGVSAPKVWA